MTRPCLQGDQGFVLIGVTIFVLALTILALSLFGLSSYEAQFMGRSMAESKAFYLAVGGIDRAKLVLARTHALEAVQVQNGSPVEGVIYALAKQGENTSGNVDWSPGADPVTIQARAVYGNTERMVEANFQPSRPSVYQNLMSISMFPPTPADTAIRVTLWDDPNDPSERRAILDGKVWQNSSDTLWTDHALGFHPVTIGGVPPVPAPDLESYWAQWYCSAEAPTVYDDSQSGQTRYELHAGTSVGDYKFFRHRAADSDAYFSMNRNVSKNVEIWVQGIAIWMFDRGVRVIHRVSVRQLPSSNTRNVLVIVARPNTRDLNDPNNHEPNAGIAFIGGLHTIPPVGSLVPPVPVFLVSDGRVGIEHENRTNQTSTVPYVSIFADQMLIMGPLQGNVLHLQHDPGVLGPNAAVEEDKLLDLLHKLGVLPNSTSGLRANFHPIPGSWREVSPPYN